MNTKKFCKVLRDKTIDLVKYEETQLKSWRNYNLSISETCVMSNILKICFEFEDVDYEERQYLVEEYVIGSLAYYDLICNKIYCGEDVEVISVNLNDFERFAARCSGEAVKDGHINWSAVDIWATPHSSIWARRHEND